MKIVCLHGMGRTRFSMSKLATSLRREGHTAYLFGYPARGSLTKAAQLLVRFLKKHGLEGGGDEVGFVCHSAGGVLLRYLAAESPNFRAGRSVALGSPLEGSIIASVYSQHWFIRAVSGKILHSLHPDEIAHLPLPPCDLAAIAGTVKTALVPANLLLRPVARDQESDSTVLLRETTLPSLKDWTSVAVAHTFLPSNPEVHRLVAHYLRHGRFGVEDSSGVN